MGSAFKRGEKVVVPSIIQVRDDGTVASLPTSPTTALTEKPSGARAFKPGDKVIADSLFQVKDDGSTDQDSAGLVNPMTGLGDLIIGGIAGALRRLAPTTVGQVLTLVAPGVPAWAAGGGGGGFTPTVDYCRIYRSAAYVLVGGVVDTLYPLDSVDLDGNSMADVANNRINIQTTGKYLVRAGLYKGAADRFIAIIMNGATVLARFDESGNYFVSCGSLVSLTAGDHITLHYLSNSGSAIVTDAKADNFLEVVRV